ncbi:PilW family protein [Aquabacterium sp.]|uniref:PilW family protein n=1 Tax=Aquabacterium sp. TaxID=1872578 RepID=UPI002CADF6F7|nr:PilW family protein [Aquabacterium sp.]HSW07801.1 PilW family protein [Aquabacterium sp.]
MNTLIAPPRANAHTARGLSIIELMVGLVVGLLVSLAAVSSAQYFTAAQRQGIGVGGGAANTASALASIKNDVANGGLGFFGNLGYLCTKLNLSVNASVVADNANFAPVQVTRVGSNDVLDIMYGSDVAAGAAVKTSGTSDGSTVTLMNYLPVTQGQQVLLASPNVGTPCLLRTVTATPAAPTVDVKESLTFNAGGQYNQGIFTVNPTYPESSLVTLIGTPQWNRYSVNGGTLQMTRVLDGTTSTLLRNVLAFHVEYGVSAAATVATDGSRSPLVLPWQKATAADWASIDQTNILRIKAVRIGIVMRSAQREKVNKETNQCEASTSKPTLFGDEIEPDVADWRCYRYRTQIVIAPLRNIIYGL